MVKPAWECIAKYTRAGTFNGLEILERLYLSGNALQEIPNGTFDELKNLERLDMSSNSLQEIWASTFKAWKAKTIKPI